MSVEVTHRVAGLLEELATLEHIPGAVEQIERTILCDLEFQTGKLLLKQGALEAAEQHLRAAARTASGDVQRIEIAQQLLQLAKTLGKKGTTDQVERVLTTAAELAPAVALPLLAQQAQRAGQWDLAIGQYRAAIRLQPDDATRYLNLARTFEQAGQPEQALATYLELLDAAPSHKNVLMVAQRLHDLTPALPTAAANRSVRIALLGNATLDHLNSYLTVECFRAGLRPNIYVGGFDQYTQDLLDPGSSLYAFAPDALICAIHASRLFPQLHAYPFDLSVEQRRAQIEDGLRTVEQLLTTFTQRSSALVLLHNMVAPQHPALGVADLRDEFGQQAMFNTINTRLAELARTAYQNVYIVDEERVQGRIGKRQATDPRLWLTARMGWSGPALASLAKEYMRYLKPYKALTRKCIVVDLDNTLWGGVVGEDGVEGVQIGADAPGNAFTALQQELERLWRRGVLLAISSKNNPEDALAVFERRPEMVLKREHFAAHRINWEPKAANIVAIAQELNIGLDSLVFLDDNPVERAKVRAELPEVLTPELPVDPAQYRQALLELDVFDTLALTNEDRRRNSLYVDQRARQELESSYAQAGSVEDYLAALQIEVEIAAVHAGTLPRVAQLTNKTNQFNLTTRRYSEAQITELLEAGAQVYAVRVLDRFGDNGLTGVAIIRPTDERIWEIDTLLLSCRVMGRGVETALLAFVLDQARQHGQAQVQGMLIPTAKNAPARDCYARHNFQLIASDPDGSERWALATEDTIATPTWLVVRMAA